MLLLAVPKGHRPEMPFDLICPAGLNAYLDKLPHPGASPADERSLLAGAKVYRDNCAVCHGLPDAPKTAIAEGMAPKPPQLFKGTGVTDDEAWESYWKVEGGIRMTGMPGFKDRLTETQIWQVAVLVKNADKIPPAVKAELTGAPAIIAAPGARARIQKVTNQANNHLIIHETRHRGICRNGAIHFACGPFFRI
jgi:mono/diheme cytochrome c family protein